MQTKLILLLFTVLLVIAACSLQPDSELDSPTDSSEYLNNVGSDTMVNLALAWAEQFQKENPQSNLSI
jgi:phosphate transport system substrate-binding protein